MNYLRSEATAEYFWERKMMKLVKPLKSILIIVSVIIFVAIYVALFHDVTLASIHAYNSLPNHQSKVAISTMGGFLAIVVPSSKGTIY